jgi:RNA polymerase sigma-32 factor
MSNLKDEVSSDANDMFREFTKHKYLSADDEASLMDRWLDNKDQKARDKIIMSHSRLALKIARTYRHTGAPLADLVQEAHVGMLEALDKFERGRGARFCTVANFFIRTRMREFLGMEVSPVSLGCAGGKYGRSAPTVYNQLQQKNPDMSHEELIDQTASVLNARPSMIRNVLRVLKSSFTSIDQPAYTYDDNSTDKFGDMLESEEDTPDIMVERKMDSERKMAMVMFQIHSFPERTQEILLSRFGEEPPTLADLSEQYKISRERARQVESYAVKKIRNALADSPVFAEA